MIKEDKMGPEDSSTSIRIRSSYVLIYFNISPYNYDKFSIKNLNKV